MRAPLQVLGKLGVIPQATNILWWKTGVFPPAGTAGIYWMDPWALFWIEVRAACIVHTCIVQSLYCAKPKLEHSWSRRRHRCDAISELILSLERSKQ